ncbi:MAG: apolipoprotein N-acyltransferase [Alphaproteobacteria bacterium]|nr:apolipoprotein N-acyltransferase [Alphaproteobacteria bacterium]
MFEGAKIKHQKTALLIAGVLSSLGFAPVYALPLSFLGFLFAFMICDESSGYKHSALTGYIFGFGFYAAGFYWASNALLVDIKTFGFLYPIALLGLGAFFGLFFILPFMVWHAFKNAGVWEKVFGFASTFVLMEYVRSFLLTGFPWNMMGTMFGFSDVLFQTASVVGTYGLSFILLVLTGALYGLCQKQYKSAMAVAISVLTVMSVFGVWRIRSYNDGASALKVRLVQPSIAQSVKWDEQLLEENLETYIAMSRKNGVDGVKFVVWGETATAFDPRFSAYHRELIKRAVPQNGYLMTGLLRYDEQKDELYNSMSVIDDKGQTVAFYDKNHLVPFGEYIPFRKFLPDWIKPVANQISDFSRGEKYKTFELMGLPKFGALICYEVIFEDEVINRSNKPQFLVVVSNDGWYGTSSGPYQHLLSARFRAVEEGVTIVRSANNGISAVIDPLGQILGRIGLNEKGSIDVLLPEVMSVSTVYAKLGGKSIQYVMLFVLVCLFLKNKLKKRQ